MLAVRADSFGRDTPGPDGRATQYLPAWFRGRCRALSRMRGGWPGQQRVLAAAGLVGIAPATAEATAAANFARKHDGCIDVS
jgi:hypothetical protein